MEPEPLRVHVESDAESALLARLTGGQQWDSAFDAYWRQVHGSPRPTLPPPDGRTNWTWLLDLPGTNRAIDLGSLHGEIAAALQLEFPEVAYVGTDSRQGRIVTERFRDNAAVTVYRDAPDAGEEQADVVAFEAEAGWANRLPSRMRNPGVLATTARAMLGKGGWFCLLLGNPWYRSSRDIERLTSELVLYRSFRNGLRRAGFRLVREYFMAPERSIPTVYVPRDRRAVRAFHEATHMHGYRGMLARLGVLAPLFPELLITARR